MICTHIKAPYINKTSLYMYIYMHLFHFMVLLNDCMWLYIHSRCDNFDNLCLSVMSQGDSASITRSIIFSPSSAGWFNLISSLTMLRLRWRWKKSGNTKIHTGVSLFTGHYLQKTFCTTTFKTNEIYNGLNAIAWRYEKWCMCTRVYVCVLKYNFCSDWTLLFFWLYLQQIYFSF